MKFQNLLRVFSCLIPGCNIYPENVPSISKNVKGKNIITSFFKSEKYEIIMNEQRAKCDK